MRLISFCILIVTVCSCAQYVPPTGGKRDSLAPKLVNSIPLSKKTNYKEKEIELNFDELIDISSLRQELLIVPELDGTFDIKQKGGDNLRITFDKPLRENTTYTFNFRNGVKDLNERNISKNLKLVFSTGDKIDSLGISGNIKNLFTDQPILDALVGIYELNDTLNFRKVKPNYFIKTDSAGNFKFENIKSSKYRLYSFIDRNNNLKYDEKSELVAFSRDTINLVKDTSGINLQLYMANTVKPKVTRTLPRSEDFIVLYDKNIKDYQVKFEQKEDSLAYDVTERQIRFFNTTTKTDTIKANITVKDSAGVAFSHLQKIKFREPDKKKKDKPELFNYKIDIKNGEDVEKEYSMLINFDYPIISYDLEKIKILSDTIRQEKLAENDIIWNKYKTELRINKKTSASKQIKTKIEKGAFINIKKDSSATSTLLNPILEEENYGLLEGRVEGDSTTKIIQLVDENYKIIKELKSKDKFLFVHVKPALYIIRIISDKNENGQWDYGDIDKGILPERIYLTKEPIRIKENFELRDQLIKLPNLK